MGVLTLAATQGSNVQVEANGEDAERAVRAIEKLFDSRFNENE
jgi:phosphotransferase system HPr (HPr) family protein